MIDYADNLSGVLLRKINKAERDLIQLKLDYCRFIFGISHRTRVLVGKNRYLVREVHLESMQRNAAGDYERPEISGILLDASGQMVNDELVLLGRDWTPL